ncbi:MAG: DsbA family protein [Acidimicrobiales bacterium]
MPVIEVFADIWCPFAHVGLRAMVTQRRALGLDDLQLWIRAWPLELVNAQPLDAHEVAEEVIDLRAQVAPDLFVGFDERAFPTTSLPALALAARAYRRDAHTGEQVSLGLRNALFEEGRNISDTAVLASIARRFGIDDASPDDIETVHDDWHDGQRRGVTGSPHFFCGGIGAFCPALDISKDDEGHLHVRTNPAALEHFVARCLAS